MRRNKAFSQSFGLSLAGQVGAALVHDEINASAPTSQEPGETRRRRDVEALVRIPDQTRGGEGMGPDPPSRCSFARCTTGTACVAERGDCAAQAPLSPTYPRWQDQSPKQIRVTHFIPSCFRNR